MKNELIKLADHLDKKGMHREANYLDALLKNAAPQDAGQVARADTGRRGRLDRMVGRNRQFVLNHDDRIDNLENAIAEIQKKLDTPQQ